MGRIQFENKIADCAAARNAKSGLDVHVNPEKTSIILSDGTDATDTVMRCLHWLQEQSF